jgi:DNA-binding response OmpR family regulator
LVLYTVMLVGGERSMREGLALQLRRAGYAIQEADDAIDAGYAVLKAAPDLIICDSALPYLDSVSFVAALRSERAIGRIPVILLAAKDDDVERVRMLGKTDYVRKPVRPEQMLAVVAKYLPRPSPLREYLATRPA